MKDGDVVGASNLSLLPSALLDACLLNEGKFSTRLESFTCCQPAGRLSALLLVAHAARPPHRVLCTFVPAAQIKGTVLLMPSGSDRITSAPLQPLQSDKSVEDEEIKALLATRWGGGGVGVFGWGWGWGGRRGRRGRWVVVVVVVSVCGGGCGGGGGGGGGGGQREQQCEELNDSATLPNAVQPEEQEEEEEGRQGGGARAGVNGPDDVRPTDAGLPAGGGSSRPIQSGSQAAVRRSQRRPERPCWSPSATLSSQPARPRAPTSPGTAPTPSPSFLPRQSACCKASVQQAGASGQEARQWLSSTAESIPQKPGVRQRRGAAARAAGSTQLGMPTPAAVGHMLVPLPPTCCQTILAASARRTGAQLCSHCL